jgi:hypothetical protein
LIVVGGSCASTGVVSSRAAIINIVLVIVSPQQS